MKAEWKLKTGRSGESGKFIPIQSHTHINGITLWRDLRLLIGGGMQQQQTAKPINSQPLCN